MRYLLMIYTNEAKDANRSPEEQEANMGAYYAYTNEIQEKGLMLGGEALHLTSATTTVRIR
ncbi:MAG: hypothetical protein GY796_08845 [Chloroflexi bacterium]|nr:hypothetical protein [Chloroflexota bacterium]